MLETKCVGDNFKMLLTLLPILDTKSSHKLVNESSFAGFRVKQRNFVFLLFFQSTDISTGVRKAKSRHDMDTAGVRVEIISLCKSTDLFSINTVS